MELFTTIDNRLDILPEVLEIKEIKDIWDRDTDKLKLRAKAELLYVYNMCSYKSVYRDYSDDKKEEYVIKAYIGSSDWKPDSKIIAACNYFKEHQYNSSASLQFLESAKSAAEKLMEYFNNINFSQKDARGNPIYKIGEVTKALADSGKILQGIETLRDKEEKEMSLNASKVRGGGKINKRER